MVTISWMIAVIVLVLVVVAVTAHASNHYWRRPLHHQGVAVAPAPPAAPTRRLSEVLKGLFLIWLGLIGFCIGMVILVYVAIWSLRALGVPLPADMQGSVSARRYPSTEDELAQALLKDAEGNVKRRDREIVYRFTDRAWHVLYVPPPEGAAYFLAQTDVRSPPRLQWCSELDLNQNSTTRPVYPIPPEWGRWNENGQTTWGTTPDLGQQTQAVYVRCVDSVKAPRVTHQPHLCTRGDPRTSREQIVWSNLEATLEENRLVKLHLPQSVGEYVYLSPIQEESWQLKLATSPQPIASTGLTGVYCHWSAHEATTAAHQKQFLLNCVSAFAVNLALAETATSVVSQRGVPVPALPVGAIFYQIQGKEPHVLQRTTTFVLDGNRGKILTLGVNLPPHSSRKLISQSPRVIVGLSDRKT